MKRSPLLVLSAIGLLLALVSTFMLCAALTGCGGGGDHPEDTTPPPGGPNCQARPELCK